MSEVSEGLRALVARALAAPRALSADDLTTLLSLRSPEERHFVRAAAYGLKCRLIGRVVSLRGLVELGNVCAKDCYYCGIRKSNAAIARYRLSPEEVESRGEETSRLDYASLVLQGGEIEGVAHAAYVEECLKRLARFNLGITLSLGEQCEDVYRRWKAAGATRYLLRIETSSPDLYATLHPADHNWERRVECLRALRRCGYQVGTGVMSCLPGQTAADLARDILFFGEMDVDMIGMGPYIPHPDTPLAKIAPPIAAEDRLETALDMIAATRLYLHDVNIASTTALQTLADDGREKGILAGANVIMPNVTETRYRARYQLYTGKPDLDENAASARLSLERRLAAIGESINYGHRGDSLHFKSKTGNDDEHLFRKV